MSFFNGAPDTVLNNLTVKNLNVMNGVALPSNLTVAGLTVNGNMTATGTLHAGATTASSLTTTGALSCSGNFDLVGTMSTLTGSVSTLASGLTLSQSGDSNGSSSLMIANRNQLNGAVLTNAAVDIVSFCFSPATWAGKVASHIRHTYNSFLNVNPANTAGELQFLFQSQGGGQSAPQLVVGSKTVQTLNNMIDDGSGNMSVAGNLTLTSNTFKNSSGSSITLPSTSGQIALTSQTPAISYYTSSNGAGVSGTVQLVQQRTMGASPPTMSNNILTFPAGTWIANVYSTGFISIMTNTTGTLQSDSTGTYGFVSTGTATLTFNTTAGWPTSPPPFYLKIVRLT